MVDATDLKFVEETRTGSIPVAPTKIRKVRRFYDHGWNDRVDGITFHRGTRDYNDGWNDAQECLSQGGKPQYI